MQSQRRQKSGLLILARVKDYVENTADTTDGRRRGQECALTCSSRTSKHSNNLKRSAHKEGGENVLLPSRPPPVKASQKPHRNAKHFVNKAFPPLTSHGGTSPTADYIPQVHPSRPISSVGCPREAERCYTSLSGRWLINVVPLTNERTSTTSLDLSFSYREAHFCTMTSSWTSSSEWVHASQNGPTAAGGHVLGGTPPGSTRLIIHFNTLGEHAEVRHIP
jgi:hypothetical protein